MATKEYGPEVDFGDLKDSLDIVIERSVGVLKRIHLNGGEMGEVIVYRTGRNDVEDPSSPVVLMGYQILGDQDGWTPLEEKGHSLDTPAQEIIDAVDAELNR